MEPYGEQIELSYSDRRLLRTRQSVLPAAAVDVDAAWSRLDERQRYLDHRVDTACVDALFFWEVHRLERAQGRLVQIALRVLECELGIPRETADEAVYDLPADGCL